MNKPHPSSPSTSGVRVVVRASLRCPTHSSANRRRAQLLVCKWVRAKWPRLANAVAYSPEHRRVVVAAREDGMMVDLTVTDQGIGIPPEEIDRIFERFYRVDPARHRSTGGTGLGLSIVKHVAASHGGEVRVWSVEGQGSTFTLSLPRRASEPAPGTSTPAVPDPHPRITQQEATP